MSDRILRALRLYRALTVILVVAVGVLGVALWRLQDERRVEQVLAEAEADLSPQARGLRFIDLRQRVAVMAERLRSAPDLAETYFTSRGGSLHLHMLAAGQQIPLHIHRTTHELTAVITGSPEVVLVHGTADGAVETSRDRYQRHELIYSPPYCGHEWINGDPEQPQANLVFSSPLFDGNFFVDADDPALQRETMPARLDPRADLAAMEGRGWFQEPLHVMPRAMSRLLVATEMKMVGTMFGRALLVLEGAATISSDRDRRVRADHLIIIPPLRDITIRAHEPTLFLLFQPDAP